MLPSSEQRSKRMRADQTPFTAAWIGTEIKGLPPRQGTYGQYDHAGLPPLPFDFRGDFAWLERRGTHAEHIGSERGRVNALALPELERDAAARGVHLPETFLRFVRDPDLQSRVRSCTLCCLDIPTDCTPIPVAEGVLVRFLADSQGCVFWYLFLPAGSTDHCIVCSWRYLGDESEMRSLAATDDEPYIPPTSSDLFFCEESFERFMCRFWFENELWYAMYHSRPLTSGERAYLAGSANERP